MNNNSTVVNVKSSIGGNRLYRPVNVTLSDDSQELFVKEILPGNQFQIYPIVTENIAEINLQKVIIQADEPIDNVNVYVKLEGPNNVNVMVTKLTSERKWELQFLPPARKRVRSDPNTVNVHLGEDEGDGLNSRYATAGAFTGFGVGVVDGAFLSGVSKTLVGVVAAASLSIAAFLWKRVRRV